MNAKATGVVKQTGQELAIIASTAVWAGACLIVYKGFSWALYQPRFHILSGGAGFQDAEFRYFTLATACCLGIWFWFALKKWGREHCSFVITWSVLALAGLAFIREVHPQTWDFMCHYLAGRGINAGINIYDNEAVATFNAEHGYGLTIYGYPPSIAAVMGQFEMLSKDQIFTLLSFLNYFALLLLGVLLYLLLLRYRLPRATSALTMLLALVVNVPVMRTFIYTQVNFWTLALIFFSVLFHRSMPFLSAFSLALAVNLRVTPLLIAGLFILACNWKWLFSFVFSLLSITIATSLMYGFDYWIYYASFLLRHPVLTEPTLMRDSSFDALVAHTFYILNIKLPNLQEWLVIGLRTGFLLWIGRLIWNVVCRGTFVGREDKDTLVLNGLPLLLVVTVMARPLVWPHHSIFLLLPVLLALKVTRERRTFGLLALVYVSLFLIPVIDVFPFDLHRLASVVLYAYSVDRILREDTANPIIIERLTGLLRNSRSLPA